MNLNGIKLTNVDIELIEPIYIESTTESALQKRLKVLRNGEMLSNYPIVEKDNVEDRYWLISGYIDYLAYSQFAKFRQQNIIIPTIEQPYSNKTFQRIKLLRKLFHDKSNWLDKHILLYKLLNDGLSIKEVAKKIGISGAELDNYLIHHELPPEIIEKAYKNNGSFYTLEQIRRTQFHPLLKYRLYLAAVLPKGNPQRLTIDKYKKVMWLFGIKEFRTLKNWREQWDLVVKVLNYKEELINSWRNECLRKSINKVSI